MYKSKNKACQKKLVSVSIQNIFLIICPFFIVRHHLNLYPFHESSYIYTCKPSWEELSGPSVFEEWYSESAVQKTSKQAQSTQKCH